MRYLGPNVLTNLMLIFVSFSNHFINCMQGFEPRLKILNSNGIIFHPKARMSFTDSEWIVATDISFSQCEDVFHLLENNLIEKSKLELRNTDNSSLMAMLEKEIVTKAKYGLLQLNLTKMRFKALCDAISSDSNNREKRETPLLAIGGKVLNFLFGVSTNDDLEVINSHLEKLSSETTDILHALEQHATVVNESLWETRTNSESISKLAKSMVSLDSQIMKLDRKYDTIFKESEDVLMIKFEIEEIFISIREGLNWVQQFTDNLGIGLASIVQGKLPPSLFPPAQLRKVVNEIRGSLPVGWALTPALQTGDIWRIYQEARVVAASHSKGLTLFIHLPVFEYALQFSLFKIISMPKAVSNGSLGLTYKALPDYLAVSDDRLSFVELNEKEASSCALEPVCMITKPIESNLKNSCVMSLYSGNDDYISNNCVPILSTWKGTKSLYMGRRTWAVSSNSPLKLTITCPNKFGTITDILQLSPVDIFELPMGCTAKSTEFLFQASFRKDIKYDSFDFGNKPMLINVPNDSVKKNRNSVIVNITSNSTLGIETELADILLHNQKTQIELNNSFSETLDKIKQKNKERLLLEEKNIADKQSSTFDLIISCTCIGLLALLLFCVGFPIIRREYLQLTTGITHEINDTNNSLESKMERKYAKLLTRLRKLEERKNLN